MQARMWTVYAAAIQKHVGDTLGDVRSRQLAELLDACHRHPDLPATF